MIPLHVSTHPVAEIQQRSAIQRRTPPRKLEGEKPNGFRSRTTSKPGSNCGATGFRGREGGAYALGFDVLHAHPSLHYIGGQEAPWLKSGGVESFRDSSLVEKLSTRSPSL